MDTVFRLLEAHKERVMEDSNEKFVREPEPSRHCMGWMVGAGAGTVTACFAALAGSAVAPVAAGFALASALCALVFFDKDKNNGVKISNRNHSHSRLEKS